MSDTKAIKVPAKIGAPTLYKPEYCDLIIRYFEDRAKDASRVVSDKIVESQKDGRKEEMRLITAELPTLESFARAIGVSRKVILDWSHRHPPFGIACARAKDIQCQLLTDRALNGQYNAQFAQFVAKNITWMKDKLEVEATTSADTDGMNHLKAMMQVATPEELTVIASLFERLEQRSLPAPSDPTT